MERHGKVLAHLHQLSQRGSDRLLSRLADNERTLLEIHRQLAEPVAARQRPSPAGEWLLDNFYLIEEQIRTAKIDLPKGYSRELPHLRNGASAGLPRVYGIALELISHADGRVDMASLSGFIEAYLSVTELKLGELWAIPIMLRLALIENLRRVGVRVAKSRIDRDWANSWADQMSNMLARDPKNLILVIADMARSNPPISSAFVGEFTRRLRGQGPALALPLVWIEQRLSESGSTIDQLVQAENRQQAADQVSVSNSIGSLRFLGATDWHEFVERVSSVEHILLRDPAGVYGRMDFATRDRYRHVVERIAKKSPLSEVEVAVKAIDLARSAVPNHNAIDDRSSHVGYYLIDKGLALLEEEAAIQRTLFAGLPRAIKRRSLLLYLGSVFIATVIAAWVLLLHSHHSGSPLWAIGLLSIPLLVSASELALSLVNWLATLLVAPETLPRMDFSAGIPTDCRTLVVVPAMLTSEQHVSDLVEGLEVRFLANRNDNVHFGLLTDFRDAKEETQPDDELLLQLARHGIEDLNEKYGSGKNSFFLFHRPRRWNAADRIWMGHERKRGKLADLNLLLRCPSIALNSRFSAVVGEINVLASVKYVITLDTDTELPRDSAVQFVGTMAHPLNRPFYDEAKRRVTEGYGILQPRVGVSLSSRQQTRYARLFGSEPGIDPYTRAVSDVYQDLFREGSFIGKGIYEVDAFEKALKDRLPENRILSHDLLEGSYARAGLLSDVELFEEYPMTYSVDVSRRQRWIRGDWQIARWVWPSVPGPNHKSERNAISCLSRWKILDNLRRSLAPAAMTFVLLLGWAILPAPWLWTLSIVGIILIPSVLAAILNLFHKPNQLPVAQHLRASARSAVQNFAQAGFRVACIPWEAYFSLRAILRTVIRVLITHRRLLEWSPFAEVASHSRSDSASYLRSMWIQPFLAIAAVIGLSVLRPSALAAALPVLALWFSAPLIAWWISQPVAPRTPRLSAGQIVFLRKLARKTWAYFQTLVGPEDHWLPPDNYQINTGGVIAHRTSPTNIGLALLANLSAYDFGYISAGQLMERTSGTFDTLALLERYRGHFYNWYDTVSLQPLIPRYVSTVDSGNLAGHLLTLRPGLLALADEKILPERFYTGLCDAMRVFAEVAPAGFAAPIEQEILSVQAAQPETLADALSSLRQLLTRIEGLAASLPDQPGGLVSRWASALVRQCQDAFDDLTFLAPSPGYSGAIPTLYELAELDLGEASRRASARLAAIDSLAARAAEMARFEYDFLYDEHRHLLAIGYNAGERRRDSGYYDLLASEARLCTFVAIAQGQLPRDSWFALGRLLTRTAGEPVLVSWSGSMFEYLMPLLVMPTFPHTLLDETCRAAVERQIDYGRARNVPWGISESGYNASDVQLNYQYRAFGVPGLGLKRGLADDLVIAPYASALALMVAPEEACRNLQRLDAEGVQGEFGFYEAVDYTPSRLPQGRSSALVRSFMSHHQGMTFLSLAYLLLDRPMQRRFISEPLFKATTLLLQERVPKTSVFYPNTASHGRPEDSAGAWETPVRTFNTADTPLPEVQLLSNGRYHVLVTNSGAGYSRWKDIAVTRWREDGTRDNWGTFCYIREVATGEYWSAGFQPTLKKPDRYEASFSEARVEFRRQDRGIATRTEITVSPEDDIELRRTTITNGSRLRRDIEITSYAEIVLVPPAEDASHPGFGNLFVQTELIAARQAILCTRRPRSADERPPWMCHLMAVHGADVQAVSYETDRAKFIGRGNNIENPAALTDQRELSGSSGSVLDPMVAIRCRFTLDPGQSAAVDFVSGVGDTREICLHLIDKYRDRHLTDRVFELAWTHSQVALRHLNATERDAQLYSRLASSIIYPNGALRAEPAILLRNRRGQSGLWGYSISGDLPIVLLRVEDPTHIDLVRQLIQAQAYWRLKGLAVDLVIWNEDHAGYRQQLQDQILALIGSGIQPNVTDRLGGIFVRPLEHVSDEDRILLQTVARVILTDSAGQLADQIDRRAPAGPKPVLRAAATRHYSADKSAAVTPRRDLTYFNGLGGFTPDAREYIITTSPGSLMDRQVTPAPWSNLLSNPDFGVVISESGMAYTWSGNAHEFRLTPWYDDPVTDASGEAFYIRDEETGRFWSPMPLPRPGSGACVTRHGFGYTIFEHVEDGIRAEVTVYVAIDATIRFTAIRLANASGRARHLSITGYVEWVLADVPSKSAMHVSTSIDPATGAIFARNRYNSEFSEVIAFFDVDDPARTITCDRTEFLGRNGTLRSPAALSRARLSGAVGPALDPCAAILVPVDLADGEGREITFTLGTGQGTDDAAATAGRFKEPGAARAALEAVWHYWNHTLGAVNVETPDASINALANGWLLYQTLACRVWGRSGYHQSGGAFGFRDQLQDVMALVHAEPRLVREHLLRAAARQFREGDVQHWWHPPSGRGVRTHCSDDYLWLPFATCRYVTTTGDTGILDESIHFIEGRPLNPEADSYYDLPTRSDEAASLYQHCVRAILRGLTSGEHGLPLIGSGDWNDGMNTVGDRGKGESVWLAFFLYSVLTQFVEVANIQGDSAFAAHCQTEAATLRRNIEVNGWDGEWYRRAYFDDGTPLGSASNTECRIDSISQSWSVLSGADDGARSRLAMDAVDKHLVRRESSLIQLLDPPFDKGSVSPGYIKGYVPGVRENGGQYTHAAIWAAMAFAKLGDRERAWDLFNILNPVNHARTPDAVGTYKVEPYVVAADVYAVAPHVGRGGWTWYTGSAGWMYRFILESLLGLTLEVDKLHCVPCLPPAWSGFKIHYRYRETVYHITVRKAEGSPGITVDGLPQDTRAIQLIDDHREHFVEVRVS